MEPKPGDFVHRFFIVSLWMTVALLIFVGFVYRAHSQAGRSRAIAAQAEMKTLADAIGMARIDTGYVIVLRALADEPGKGTFNQGNVLHFKIQSEPIPFAIDKNGFFIQTANFPYSQWKGPYINYQTVCTTGFMYQPSAYGASLDPWGNPYKFFTPKLLTNPAPNDPTVSPFAQNTLVSYGPDGLPGNNGRTQVGTGDDIVYGF